jgi:Xaa-Pro dipeptidase
MSAELTESSPPSPSRRDDIERKQEKVAKLLIDTGCEGLLILDPANFRWMTSGAAIGGLQFIADAPALYVSSNQRWLLCSSIDTQRYFDEELDGLGFQVKEWAWHVSRDHFLEELIFARKVVCDRTFKDCKLAGAFLEQERRRLSALERGQVFELGRLTAHALEATARSLEVGDTEEETAGHLAHRLLRHGLEPVSLEISADDRAGKYRRPRSTSEPIRHRCLLQATASRSGLFVTASRMVCFGEPDEALKREFEVACRQFAYWLAASNLEERFATPFAVSRFKLKNTLSTSGGLGRLAGSLPAAPWKRSLRPTRLSASPRGIWPSGTRVSAARRFRTRYWLRRTDGKW